MFITNKKKAFSSGKERRDCDRHGHCLKKPTRAILLCLAKDFYCTFPCLGGLSK